MNFTSKPFDKLTAKELYEILRLRAEIFVVEQNIVYQDMDGTDYVSLHFFLKEDERVAAYCRAYPKTNCPDTVKIGRVVTLRHGEGLGRKLMEYALPIVRKEGYKKVYIEAQEYALGFYEKFGFKVVSGLFMIDNIPHKAMELEF